MYYFGLQHPHTPTNVCSQPWKVCIQFNCNVRIKISCNSIIYVPSAVNLKLARVEIMPKRDPNFCPTTIVVDQNLGFHNGYRLLVWRGNSCSGQAGFFNNGPRT